MNIKLQHQKMQTQIALNYLSLVELCEENISKGIDVVNSVARKNEYADKYVEMMSNNVIVSCNSERLEELRHILTLKLLNLKILKFKKNKKKVV
jgi:hypothetical protein